MIFGLRYLSNKETMAMIQNGMDPKLNKATPQPYKNLKWGLLLMGAGIGLFIAFMLDNAFYTFADSSRDNDNVFFLYVSLLSIFGGLGLFISFLMEKKALS
ncbi:hypothetical protein GS398_06085 [Pedobacter sp. HMF7056]|uniref:DUF6249 domain-containing protein n=2 Tax=Hufsiella ginkgonis TaxID=2695274 RepID=A0A7K1XVQ9_9SPHI|nr:hypothetical protein [Hufsiella ginkgonis]